MHFRIKHTFKKVLMGCCFGVKKCIFYIFSSVRSYIIIYAVPSTALDNYFYLLFIGGLNLDKCGCEHYIPIWLIVGGAAAIINQILEVCKRIMEKREEDSIRNEEPKPSPVHSCFSGLLGCFNLAWFICGE